ncbi:PilW family protein [Halomonas sp. HAL1]|uniref:PilW family protein n=1 Tax=Halomonas sp. HAL1 TaxID=550984 RepID=UPI00022D2D22|nr:prepilin-type N-terminal cleavage/methylation domain-containing protein [Halomonas sp. HAL1]EHA14360.1 hypothetical protein HAL1_16881 [Halomonas sp. HAL1]WKV92386.1 prepilin-type N-terminal cleavage/methylation domain-containing protein [Halomonas sp. HAL1]
MRCSESGFTLVELMVAMTIGTVIVLGAGQLFLTTFQTFRIVDELSRKQEALIFITGALVQDVRSATHIDAEPNNAAMKFSLHPGDDCNKDELLERIYFLSETNGRFSLSVSNKCESESEWGQSEPLVEGFYDDSAASFLLKEEGGGGLYKLVIRLAKNEGEIYEEIVLRIQNRVEAFL